MSTYKPKGSPFWHYDFKISGNRFCGSTGTTSKEDAKAIEARERSKALTRIHSPENIDLRISDAFLRYWNEHAKQKKSSTDMFQRLGRLEDGLGKDKMLRSITNMDVTDYIARRRSEVSDSSVNRETAILRAVLNRASKAWDISLKPLNWEAHRLKEPKGRVRSLTEEEEINLFKHLREDFKPFVRFCLITGARVTSVRNLKWSDIDLDAGEIRLDVKSRFTGEFHTLPITTQIRAVLDSMRGFHPIYVFTYLSGGNIAKKRLKGLRYPFARDGWRGAWERTLKNAKITNFRFHDLRHTAATQMLRATKNLAAVKEVLGHKDVTTTMRYAHVLKDDIKAALSRNNPEIENKKEDKKSIRSIKTVVK